MPAIRDRRIKRSSVMGGMNYHIEIEFDDGMTRLARIRRSNTASSPPALKHADNKSDHILVDDQGNIPGTIDWEWARTAPKILAFNSPIMLLPVADFYNGINDTGKDVQVFPGSWKPRDSEIWQQSSAMVDCSRFSHFAVDMILRLTGMGSRACFEG